MKKKLSLTPLFLLGAFLTAQVFSITAFGEEKSRPNFIILALSYLVGVKSLTPETDFL